MFAGEVRREGDVAGEGPDAVPAGVAGFVYSITNLLNGVGCGMPLAEQR